MASNDGGTTNTICPYCGVGCGLGVQETADGTVTFRPWADAPVNEGRICIKGGAATEVVDHPDRLETPLLREEDGFREATWEEALTYVAEEYRRIAEEHGPDAMGFFASSQATNEANYLFQRLARCVGTNNIDNCARLCHSSTVVALSETLGRGAMTNSLADLREADVYWMQGANPAENHPIAHAQYFRPAIEDGTTLVQVDPHENKTTADADIHLRVQPGTDIALLNAVLATIVENGWDNAEFLTARTTGVSALREHLGTIDRHAAADRCGVPLEQIEAAAERFATADRGALFTGMGMSQHTSGTDNVRNLINLALLTGNVGRPGTGVNPLRGQNNVQGASDVGALPGVLPGYQSVTDPAVREAIADVWGVESLPAAPGLTNLEMTHAVGDEIRGLHVMGENPAMSEPNTTVVRDRLAALEFLCVQDLFLTETAELADVVLPASSWAESSGTVTNTDRRVQLMRSTTPVRGGARQDWATIAAIGERVLDNDWDFSGPEAIFAELRETCPIIAGMTYDRLDPDGLQWPCTDSTDPGTQHLYAESFATDDGLARVQPVAHREPAETGDETYPLTLTTGRIEEHFNSGAMTTRSETLIRVAPENFLEVHPRDAEARDIEDGDRVRLCTRRGDVEVTARVTDGVKPGVLWSTPHFSDAPINRVTNDALDPEAKIPEYKVAAGSVAADIQPVTDADIPSADS